MGKSMPSTGDSVSKKGRIMGTGKNWRSLKPYKAEKIHAPSVYHDVNGTIDRGFAYCTTKWDPEMKIAKKGQVIDCQRCLVKLRGRPQYANFLRMTEGILMP